MFVIEGGAFCVSCFNFVTDQKVVDLGAAWEGGVQDGLAIDDLRLCEGCVKTAAEALEVNPVSMELAERRVERAEAEAERWRLYAEGLEAVRSIRPEDLPEVKKTGRKKAAA
jgi:hypothetical protein